MAHIIPVVDFNVYKLGISDVTDENLQEVSKEIRKAFTEVGFVYLKNTGIDPKEVGVSILTGFFSIWVIKKDSASSF